MTTGFATAIGASWTALLAACVLGCVPMRGWQVRLSGRLHRAHTPLAGATVTWLNIDSASSEGTVQPAGSAVTDDRGEFAIPARHRCRAGALPADVLVEWRVELKFSGQTTTLWEERLVVPGRHSTPGRVTLDCDIAEAEPWTRTSRDCTRQAGGYLAAVGVVDAATRQVESETPA